MKIMKLTGDAPATAGKPVYFLHSDLRLIAGSTIDLMQPTQHDGSEVWIHEGSKLVREDADNILAYWQHVCAAVDPNPSMPHVFEPPSEVKKFLERANQTITQQKALSHQPQVPADVLAAREKARVR